MKKSKDTISVKGFMRVQIVNKRKKVVGDSGWLKNLTTNYGFINCFGAAPVGLGTKITNMVLGSGSTPVITDTALPGCSSAQNSTLAASSSVGSAGTPPTFTFRCSQIFNGNPNSMAALGNVGLLVSTLTNQLACGVGFATSSLGTDQSVNVTYDLRYYTG